LLLTDVDAVYRGWGTGYAEPIAFVHADALNPAEFSEGSMRPKVEAAIGFVNETGRLASIGRLHDVAEIIKGRVGTTISL
jgi:carbamate kinase